MLRPWTVLALTLLAAACAVLAPDEREVMLSAERLSELLGRRLSVEKKFFDLLELRTGKPTVVLDAREQRLRVDLDVSLGHPFSSRPLHGQAALSGALAFDAGTRSVLLVNPRVEKLEFERVPPALREPVSRLGAALGRELLDRYPLATLEPEQLKWHGQEYRVLGFDITEKGLKVLLRRQQP